MPGALSFPTLVTSLSSDVTKVFNTHDKAECKSEQRVKGLGDGTSKTMTWLLGLPPAVGLGHCLQALDLQPASMPLWQEIVFARNKLSSCFERWRYSLLLAVAHHFSSFSLQGSPILFVLQCHGVINQQVKIKPPSLVVANSCTYQPV